MAVPTTTMMHSSLSGVTGSSLSTPSSLLFPDANIYDETNNTSQEEEIETPGCRLYKFVVLTIIGGMICLFGFLGNIIAFIVFQKDTMKTSTSFLFQALSVIDNVLLFTVFPLYCVPALLKYMYPDHYSSGENGMHPITLVYVYPVAFLGQTATIWVTVLVGVNRYIAVCKPFQAARLCTVRQAKLQLAVVLSLVTLYCVPRFAQARLAYVPLSSLVSQDLEDIDVDIDNENRTTSETAFAASGAESGNTSAHIQMEDDDVWVLHPFHTALSMLPLYYVIYDNILYTIVMLVLPLTTLTALNVRLIRELRALRRKRIEMLGSGSRRITAALSTSGGSGQAQSAQDSNVTLVLVIVVLVFIVCQVPALVTQLFWNLLDDRERNCGGIQYYFGCVSNLLVVANSAANFPIYILFNTRFRLVLRQTFCPAAADFLFHVISSRTPGSSKSKPVTPQPVVVD